MKAPFFKLYVKKGKTESRDLTGYCEDFNYEDSDDKDAYAEFRLDGLAKNERNEYLMNDLDIHQGNHLQFQFGFIGGIVSQMHEITIAELKFDYGQGRCIAILRCLDKGNVIKRGANTNLWKNVSASGIAKAIAEKYDMTTRITETPHVYQSLPQSGKSDFEMLQWLAHKEGAINCYVSNNTLVFERTDYGKKSKRLFTFGGDNILHFSTNVSNAHKGKGNNGVVVSGVDVKTGTTFVKTALMDAANGTIFAPVSVNSPYYENAWEKQVKKSGILDTKIGNLGTQTGNFKTQLDNREKADIKIANGNKISIAQRKTIQQNAIVNIHPEYLKGITDSLGMKTVGAINEREAAEKAEAHNENAKKDVITANLDIELDSSFNIGDIVTIDGLISDRDKGNWYVKEIRHSITHGNIAKTSFKLTRNAISKGNGNKADGAVNDSKGKNSSQTEKQMQLNAVTGEFEYKTPKEIQDLFAKYTKTNLVDLKTLAEDLYSTKK